MCRILVHPAQRTETPQERRGWRETRGQGSFVAPPQEIHDGHTKSQERCMWDQHWHNCALQRPVSRYKLYIYVGFEQMTVVTRCMITQKIYLVIGMIVNMRGPNLMSLCWNQSVLFSLQLNLKKHMLTFSNIKRDKFCVYILSNLFCYLLISPVMIRASSLAHISYLHKMCGSPCQSWPCGTECRASLAD